MTLPLCPATAARLNAGDQQVRPPVPLHFPSTQLDRTPHSEPAAEQRRRSERAGSKKLRRRSGSGQRLTQTDVCQQQQPWRRG